MKYCLLSLALTLFGFGVRAQQDHTAASCAQTKQRSFRNNHTLGKPTIGDPLEENYDVQYVHLDLSLDNNSSALKGVATTHARTTVAMNEYAFELIADYTIDSLKVNGTIRPVTLTGYVRKAALPAALPAGSQFTVQVYYHGTVTSGGGFFDGGIRTQTSPTWGTEVTYTLSEPFAAKDWWPCKQSLQDKIDSSDVWLTMPAALKGGSNGVLKAITPIAGGKVRYEWKNSNPIDYYLISVAVAPYVDYSYYMHFNGSTDSMLVQNYVYDNPLTLPEFQDVIDSTGPMINYFSGVYGRYPFWKEKYGHCMAPLGGGMEHQTMTTLGNFSTSLVAHELGHQWFGDNVTCGTWADIWLNEGFASYSEYLYEAHSNGALSASFKMSTIHNNVMDEPDGSLYCTDTTDEGRIFDNRLTYDKGAAIVHTLRFAAGNDALFFELLQHYQQQFGGSTATTEQFKTFAASEYGQNLDAFFSQWIYGEGYPTYAAKWNQIGDQVILRLSQTTSKPSSVAFFETPLEIRLSSATGDTVVKVYNNVADQNFTFTWNKTMTGMAIDPNNWILNKTGGIVKDNTLLSLEDAGSVLRTVYPNPTLKNWTVDGLTQDCSLNLTDMSGRLLWQGSNGNKTSLNVDASGLSTGMYLLRIADKQGRSQNMKLLKSE